jgi:hypothetical protein
LWSGQSYQSSDPRPRASFQRTHLNLKQIKALGRGHPGRKAPAKLQGSNMQIIEQHGGVYRVDLSDNSPSECERGKSELRQFLDENGKDVGAYQLHLRRAWDPVQDKTFFIMCAYPNAHELAYNSD